jgi:hypothetical protein
MHFHESLAIGKAELYLDVVAVSTGGLAELALNREHWPEAESLAREALKLAENIGRRELIAADCRRLAKALVRQRHASEGRSHAKRAGLISPHPQPLSQPHTRTPGRGGRDSGRFLSIRGSAISPSPALPRFAGEGAPAHPRKH